MFITILLVLAVAAWLANQRVLASALGIAALAVFFFDVDSSPISMPPIRSQKDRPGGTLDPAKTRAGSVQAFSATTAVSKPGSKARMISYE